MSSSMSMSMSLNIPSLIMSGLNKSICEIVCEVVMYCGSVHNFDGSEMIRSMNLEDMCVISSKKVLKEKKVLVLKEKEIVGVKSKVPMPFNGCMKDNCCRALRQNQGLYTQCETIVSDGGFCKKCGPSASYGTIEQRLSVGIMEYRDPKGKAPTPFVKVMKKLKISREEVESEAGKLNIIINDIHFQEEEVEKKEKGRPKKPRRKIELADDSTDLFAALVAKANEESEEEVSDLSSDEKQSVAESIVDSVLDKVSVIAENNEKKAEKVAEKAEKEATKLAEKEAAKLALIQKKEAEKAEKEAAKLAEIQKKEAEKAEKEAAKLAEIQKKEAEKAEKEAAKQKKEAEKEAAKLALIQKKEAEKAEKEAAKQKKEAEKPAAKAVTTKSKKESSDSETEKVAKPAAKAAKKDEEEADVVKRFEFEGVKYLKSKNTGIIYNMEQDVIGKWNEKTGKIDFEEAGSEEEEDEYDE